MCKMKKNYAAKIVCMILALVMIAACFAACGETKENNGGTTADGTWYFGGTGPLTGSAAQYGNSVKEGAQLAVDEINAAGGINGYKINFDMKDDENDPEKAGINNLISIMAAVTGRTIEDIVKEYSGKGYGEFKADIAEAVVENIRPIREKYDDLSKNKDYLVSIYENGAKQANYIANKTLNKVKKKIGFII